MRCEGARSASVEWLCMCGQMTPFAGKGNAVEKAEI
jgi:hypothetical protein